MLGPSARYSWASSSPAGCLAGTAAEGCRIGQPSSDCRGAHHVARRQLIDRHAVGSVAASNSAAVRGDGVLGARAGVAVGSRAAAARHARCGRSRPTARRSRRGPAAAAGRAGAPTTQPADIDDVADAIRAAAGPVTLTVTAQTPSWGYLRVSREDASGEWQQVGRFTDAPHAFGEHPTPPGSWSIHNTEVLGDRAYSSWYSNGIVAIDVSDPTQPERVGQFVPDTSRRHANSLGVGPAEVRGVAIDPETGIVYASDMRTGLWIVEPTGPAAPSS